MRLLESDLIYDQSVMGERSCVPTVSFTTAYESELLDNYSQLPDCDNKALKVLQTVSSHIQGISFESLTYKVETPWGVKRLPFQRLSRGESLILICYIAKCLNKPLTVCYDVVQLSKENLLYFIELFKDFDKLAVVASNNGFYILMENLINGKMGNRK